MLWTIFMKKILFIEISNPKTLSCHQQALLSFAISAGQLEQMFLEALFVELCNMPRHKCSADKIMTLLLMCGVWEY